MNKQNSPSYEGQLPANAGSRFDITVYLNSYC